MIDETQNSQQSLVTGGGEEEGKGEEVVVVSFRTKLEKRIEAVNSLLCIGLDPHENELKNIIFSTASDEEKCYAAYTFCKTLIDQTISVAACYKPNIAFFEALGAGGLETLKRILQLINNYDHGTIPILLDIKRGDIGTTAQAYASASYDYLQYVDAVTLSPLMGYDSIQPFISGKYSGKGAFLLCKTSNPGSNDLLALTVQSSSSSKTETLYERIASLVGNEWLQKSIEDAKKKNNNTTETPLLGLVVGATDPDAIRRVRSISGDSIWILAPGVGAQGGNLIETCMNGFNSDASGLLIPVSRGISTALNPKNAAEELRQEIEHIRQQFREQNKNITTTTTFATNTNQPKTNEEKVVSSVTKKSSSSDVGNAILLQQYQKEFIEFSLQQGVLKFGNFTLKSGRISPYFFNAGLFASGAALYKLGKAYSSTIISSTALVDGSGKDAVPKFDVIFGPAYKGISLGAVVSCALYSEFGLDIGFAYNRKEAKDHGEGGTLVGTPLQGKRVLIVDDVITAGTAVREVYTLLEQVDAKPVGVVIALDRAEIRSIEDRVSAVQAVERDMSIQVVPIINLKELQAFIEQSPDYDDATLQSVIDYRSQYGA